jgi:hypothetical protein
MKGALNLPNISAFLTSILASSSVHFTCRGDGQCTGAKGMRQINACK